MQVLNLPQFDLKIRNTHGKIEVFDVIRKKYIVLLPEEWVRQNMIHYLLEYLKYPKSLFKVEDGLKYNRLSKRSDILIYDNRAKPLLLVECKSFKVPINQKALDQVCMYNKQHGAHNIVLTNGLNHYCCSFDGIEYKFIDNIPKYQ